MNLPNRLAEKFIDNLVYLAAAAILGMDLAFLAHGFGLL